MKARLIIALLAASMFCVSAVAQENISLNQLGISGNISERNPFQGEIQDYDHSLRIDPGNASAWLGKAVIFQILGNHNESQEALRKALNATNETLKKNSQDANAWQARGVVLAGLSKNDEAISALQKSIAILDQKIQRNPEDAESWWLKAESYEALYMDNAAIQAYDKVIELNSTKTVGAWIRIADILFVKANGYNESVKAFSNATKLMPDNATWAGGSVLDQGNSTLHTDFWADDNKILRVTIGSYNKSKEEYGFIEQIVSKPVSTWLIRDNGIDLLKMLPDFITASVRMQENASDSWYKKGQELEKMGSWEDALKAYDHAINLNPQYAEAWSAKGNVLSIVSMGSNSTVQNRTIEDAINAADKAIEIDPSNGKFWFSKGMVLAQIALATSNQSRYNESLQDVDKAIEISGTNKTMLAEAWYGKGYVLNLMGKSAEALEAHSKAIELNQSYAEAWVGKATVLSRLEKYEDAVNAYDKVFDIYTSDEKRLFDYPYLWYSKARALEKLGREEEAAQACNKSVADVDKIIAKVSSGQKFYMNLSEAWQYKGQLLEEMGRYEEAIKALDNVTKINPDSIGAWNEKGFLLATELGRYNESIEAYDRALKIDPNDGEALVGKGNVLGSLGRYDEAEELFDKALQMDSRLYYLLAKAWYGKGEVLRNQGRFNESINAYDKAMELDPRYPEDALTGKGAALESLDRHNEAINAYNQSLIVYDKAAKNNPKRADLWKGKGDALVGLGRYNESLQAYDKAIELNPKDIDAWLGKADALFESNFGRVPDRQNMNESITTYETAITLMPDSSTGKLAYAWEKKAFALANLGDMMGQNRTLYEESIRAYDKAIKIEPDSASAWTGKASVLATRLSNGVKAVEVSNSAVNLSRENPTDNEAQIRALEVQGLSLVKAGKYEEAISAYDRLIEITPQNSYPMSFAWKGKGDSLCCLKKYEGAISAYEKALKTYPRDLDRLLTTGIFEGKGDCLEALGRHDEAIAAYDKAIDAHPKNAPVIFKKGLILKALGRTSEADFAFAKAKELGYQR